MYSCPINPTYPLHNLAEKKCKNNKNLKLKLFETIIREVKNFNLNEEDEKEFMKDLLDYQDFDYIQILLDNDKIKNLDLKFKNKRLLMYAFENKKYDLFKSLLLKGANLNFLDTDSKLNILISMQFKNYLDINL